MRTSVRLTVCGKKKNWHAKELFFFSLNVNNRHWEDDCCARGCKQKGATQRAKIHITQLLCSSIIFRMSKY